MWIRAPPHIPSEESTICAVSPALLAYGDVPPLMTRSGDCSAVMTVRGSERVIPIPPSIRPSDPLRSMRPRWRRDGALTRTPAPIRNEQSGKTSSIEMNGFPCLMIRYFLNSTGLLRAMPNIRDMRASEPRTPTWDISLRDSMACFFRILPIGISACIRSDLNPGSSRSSGVSDTA